MSIPLVPARASGFFMALSPAAVTQWIECRTSNTEAVCSSQTGSTICCRSSIDLNRRLIREQAVSGMPTEEFDERAARLNERYKAADEKLARLKAEREDHLIRGKGIRRFLSALDEQAQSLEDWDEQAWNLLVSRVIIQKDGSAEFIFRGEITITVRAE